MSGGLLKILFLKICFNLFLPGLVIGGGEGKGWIRTAVCVSDQNFLADNVLTYHIVQIYDCLVSFLPLDEFKYPPS